MGRPVTGKTPTTCEIYLASASPQWQFSDATFAKTARALDNPDHVAITISNYRWRLGLEKGEAKYAGYEQRLAALPPITVPTITLEGANNGAPHPLRQLPSPNLPVNMSTGICRERWAITRRRRIRRRLCRRWWTPIVCNPRLAGGATCASGNTAYACEEFILPQEQPLERIDHILVVDDDRDIRELIVDYLEKSGYRASGAANGKAMWSVLKNHQIDLIVLDIMMPGEDGLTLCRQLRANPQQDIPVLMLTARTDDSDRILGLEMGADDYLIKPFVARELLARIKAILRRTRALPPNLQITEAGRLIAFGDWLLDTAARHLLDDSGAIVALSGAEYRLLRVFLDHPQRVLNRDQLLNLTQGRDAELFERSIDLLVSRLRQRLREDAREPAYIKTVRSEGYVLSVPVSIRERHE